VAVSQIETMAREVAKEKPDAITIICTKFACRAIGCEAGE
jgi:hypothetical protein